MASMVPQQCCQVLFALFHGDFVCLKRISVENLHLIHVEIAKTPISMNLILVQI
uniref:Uncharacterized protein n=1 Tax=Rhizophora mucronata TaxID=61149 RepID=A0A2P2J0Q8_RHIMU